MPDKKQIDGHARSIGQILGGTKYGIDFYQREYKWGKEQISTLIEDLATQFLLHFDPKKDRTSVRDYPHYFLGSFVLSVKDKRYIIDGQQRLTSITLLLIYLKNLSEDRSIPISSKIGDLIFSEEYGVRSFNIDVEDRKDVMDKLFTKETFDVSKANESSRTLYERYMDIVEKFSEEMNDLIGEEGKVLPYFIDWLIGNVDMVEITAYSDEEAYTIFETMNDRGLSLTPSEMLKSFLLAKITDDDKRQKANDFWKERSFSIKKIDNDKDEEFLKTWIRSKYAVTMRQSKEGSTNKDFEIIGTRFQKWVRDNKEKMEIDTSDDFYEFIMSKYNYFSDVYLTFKNSSDAFNPVYPHIFYTSYHNFAYRGLLLLSAIKFGDDADTVRKKMQIVSLYAEILIVLRSINYSTLGSSAIRYTMFTLMKDLRNLSLSDLVSFLKERVTGMEEKWEGIPNFALNQRNYPFTKFFLARITQYIESKSNVPSSFEIYMNNKQKKPYEIEHILANKYDRYAKEFDVTEQEFQDDWRNSIGGLLLIQEGFNQSYGDLPYEEKMKHYYKQNLLASSLNPQCYDRDPSFVKYIQESKLNFKPYEHFGKEAIADRCQLLRRICEEIWDIREFDKILNS